MKNLLCHFCGEMKKDESVSCNALSSNIFIINKYINKISKLRREPSDNRNNVNMKCLLCHFTSIGI